MVDVFKKSPRVNVIKCIRDTQPYMHIYLRDSSLSVCSFLVSDLDDMDLLMQWAAKDGHESVVRYLVDKGADVHADNDLAMRWAARHGHESVVRYLTELSKEQTQP